jgi:oligopeptide transport system permease protein
MVPILPIIVASFVGVLEGSVIIEQIFSIPGIGQLYVNSVKLLDYDVFMADSIFYTFIGLSAQIVIDVCYGLIDPRIRIGER